MHRVPGEAVGRNGLQYGQNGFQRFLGGLGGGLHFLVGIHGKVILGHFVDKVDLLGDIAHQLAPLVQHLGQQGLVAGRLDDTVDIRLGFSKNASSLMARMYSALI